MLRPEKTNAKPIQLKIVERPDQNVKLTHVGRPGPCVRLARIFQSGRVILADRVGRSCSTPCAGKLLRKEVASESRTVHTHEYSGLELRHHSRLGRMRDTLEEYGLIE
jgi:hypothetical protein